MTNENLNALKRELLKLYESTEDIYSLINDSVRLGILAERTKGSDEGKTMEDVYKLFNADGSN